MGNTFEKFWKFPDPSYVADHYKTDSNPGTLLQPTYPIDMSIVKPETLKKYQDQYNKCSAYAK